jgi:glutamine amidotransferase
LKVSSNQVKNRGSREMPTQVTIVDYGIGNISSVSRAIQHFGAEARLTDNPDEIMNATRLVLPGVGAFLNGMQGLRERGLVEPLRAYAASGRPLLGICLGMQMLLTASEEFGEHEGLGIIPGRVLPVVAKNDHGNSLKVPHIGWSGLSMPPSRQTWDNTVLEPVPVESSVYFVHSFMAVPIHEEHRLADTMYGDCRISAAIQMGKVTGCQFHPEKSGTTGLRIIQNFVNELNC